MRACSVRSLVWIVACSSLAYAADAVVEKPVSVDTPEKFAIAVKQIRQEMGSGGRYEFIRTDDRGKVNADLDTMQGLLNKAGSADAMKMEDKVRLFNTQEHVNGLLTHSDSNRLVCERRAPVGTSIPQTTCKTVGEIERQRQNTRDFLQETLLDSSKCRDAAHCRSN
jgi:hypothetical protein